MSSTKVKCLYHSPRESLMLTAQRLGQRNRLHAHTHTHSHTHTHTHTHSRGTKAKELNCDIVVSQFEFRSCY